MFQFSSVRPTKAHTAARCVHLDRDSRNIYRSNTKIPKKVTGNKSGQVQATPGFIKGVLSSLSNLSCTLLNQLGR
jgi:hypothetical protein